MLSFREFSIGRALDLVIARKVIYELKSVSELLKSHEGQLLEYLYLTNSTRGKLLNFRTMSVESRFVNTTFDRLERQTFGSMNATILEVSFYQRWFASWSNIGGLD